MFIRGFLIYFLKEFIGQLGMILRPYKPINNIWFGLSTLLDTSTKITHYGEEILYVLLVLIYALKGSLCNLGRWSSLGRGTQRLTG